MYTINLKAGTVTRDVDGVVVSPTQSTDDPDFVAYNQWVIAGNQPTINNTPFLSEEIYIQSVQLHLDMVAQQKGYDDIKSAALRAAYPGPFHDEGIAAATWMDSCWATCFTISAQVKAGQIQAPTVEELIAQLPAPPW